MMAVALSWIAVSCSGPVFFKPPMAAGTPMAASATVAAPPVAAAAASPWSGAGVFILFALALAVTLGISNFILSSKPPETV